VTGPNDPVGDPANDENETAPTGRTLEADEEADIEEQVAAILTANQGREPDEQVSVAPEDVN
jgi:hypothetical protein